MLDTYHHYLKMDCSLVKAIQKIFIVEVKVKICKYYKSLQIQRVNAIAYYIPQTRVELSYLFEILFPLIFFCREHLNRPETFSRNSLCLVALP